MNPKKQALQTWRYDRQLFLLLFSPSWISGFFCIITGIATTVIVLTQGQYEGSELQRQFFTWQQSGQNNTISQTFTHLEYGSLGKTLATIQVFIFWYIVGLIGYVVLMAVYNTLRGIQEIKRDLNYINTTPSYVLRGVGLQLARQLIALGIWSLWIIFTLKTVIPYALSTIQVANGYLPAISAISELIAATVGIAFCLHVHMVLIRLFLGRPRVWHSEAYIESLPRMN